MSIAVTLSSARGESGGISRLILNFLAKNISDRSLGIAHGFAEMRVVPSPTEYDISKSFFVGHAFMEDQTGQFSKQTEQSWTFALPLFPSTLQKIEEMRNGGDLFLRALFFCTAVSIPDAASPLTALGRATVSSPASSDDYCPFRIAQSDWVRTLKDLGYGDAFLIEVPLRGVPARAGMRKALAHLENAWEHYNEGKDEETLVSCYKAFEFLAKQMGTEAPDQNGFDKFLQGRINDQRKRRSVSQLLDYIGRYLALTRHEQGQEKSPVDRRDSEYALILAQASLAYLAKCVSNEPKISTRGHAQSG
jgi:hypothetical protein